MLVLRRKTDEKVILTVNGIRIEVVLIEVRGSAARIGFHAPMEVAIHRNEVQPAIECESQSRP